MSSLSKQIRRKRALEADGMTTQLKAAALLAKIRPDPDVEQHRADLLRDLGWQCVVKDCQRQSRAFAMCDGHYRAYRRIIQERST